MLRWSHGFVVAAVGIGACTPAAPARADRSDPATVSAAPEAAAAPSSVDPRPPVHRVRGELEGGFVVPRQVVRVAEPIMVAFDVRSTRGSMVAFIGGDQRNAANFPTRVAVKVERLIDRNVVCDNVEAPALMSFGGIGSDRTFAEGELLHETFVLNPSCPALAEPGTYRLTLHRRITTSTMTTIVAGSDVPTSCDVHPLHEHATLDDLPAECARMLRDAAAVTTELDLVVLPYDREPVKSAIETAYENADASKDEIASNRLDAWLCGWVTCGCARPTDARTMPLPETTPPTLVSGCPRPR